MSEPRPFKQSIAVVIGVDSYRAPLSELRTAANDARELGRILREDHAYDHVIEVLDAAATRARISDLLSRELPALVGPEDRALFYFAGHGVARDGQDGPNGYLMPADANPRDIATQLHMPWVHDALTSLPCRHMLIVLDACFAGAFRWSATRSGGVDADDEVTIERYERFVNDPAWQVITSASSSETANDALATAEVGTRYAEGKHSPFAEALFGALRGEADVIPAGTGDGLVTVSEMFAFVMDKVLDRSQSENKRQTPSYWPLQKHGRGEYLFFVPGKTPALKQAPPLSFADNPWRGLESYGVADRKRFYGRDSEIEQLLEKVRSNPFTVVLGASGTGKSSLVKAGVLPHLADDGWHVLPVMRPDASPFTSLRRALSPSVSDTATMTAMHATPIIDASSAPGLQWAKRTEQIRERVAAALAEHSKRGVVLLVDQFEELLTLVREQEERSAFLALLALLVREFGERLRVIVTLRSDFKPSFDDAELFREPWRSGQFVVPPMSRADLRAAIERPATSRVLYFEPPLLVEQLVDEVVATPGALPLLSFAMSEMYIGYVKRQNADRQRGIRTDRSITQADFDALGGVVGALRARADAEYGAMNAEEQATAQRVWLRMVSAEGGNFARRRVTDDELVFPTDAENARIQAVVSRLTAARLLVRGERDGDRFVEPAHDALVRGWVTLIEWVRAAADAPVPLATRQKLAAAAAEWDRAEQVATDAEDTRIQSVVLRLTALARRERDGQRFVEPARDTRVRGLARFTLWTARTNPFLAKTLGWDAAEKMAKAGLLWSDPVRGAMLRPEVRAQSPWMNDRELRFAKRSVRGGTIARWVRIGTIAAIVAAAGAAVWQANEATRQAQLASESALVQVAQVTAERGQWIRVAELLRTLGLDNPPRGAAALARRAIASVLPLAVLEGHTDAVLHATYSPDGALVATASQDGSVRLWDAFSGQPPHEFLGHQQAVRSVAFSSDGAKLVTASADASVRIWNVESGAQLAVLTGHDGNVRGAVFDTRGTHVASAGEDGTVRLWTIPPVAPSNWASVRPTHVLRHRAGAQVMGVAYSPDGAMVASSLREKTAHLWNATTGTLERTLTGHTDEVRTIQFDPSGTRVLTASRDATARIWDVATGRELLRMAGHHKELRSAAYSRDGRMIVTTSEDSTARLWDAASGRMLDSLVGHHDQPIWWAEFSKAGDRVVTASPDGTARIWDATRSRVPPALSGHTAALRRATFSPDGRLAATASDDGTARIWNAVTGDSVAVLRRHTMAVSAVHFSPDGRQLLTSSTDGTAELWRPTGGTPNLWASAVVEHEFLHEADITDARFSGDGRHVVTASVDRTARIWNARTGALEATLTGHSDEVRTAAFDSSGHFVVTASRDSTARLWDASTGRLVRVLRGHSNELRSAMFSPDGKRVVTTSEDLSVKQWNVATGKTLDSLIGHRRAVYSAEYSPNGEEILTASLDGLALIWDAQGSRIIDSLPQDGDELRDAAFSSDGRRVVTAGRTNRARIWWPDWSDLRAGLRIDRKCGRLIEAGQRVGQRQDVVSDKFATCMVEKSPSPQE